MMQHRFRALALLAVPASLFVAWNQAGLTTAAAWDGVIARASGGGHYDVGAVPPTVPAKFAFTALDKGNGEFHGRFHHKADVGGLNVEFHADVTCLAVDSANGRAWIGGVITENRSEHPGFQTAIHQPGQDIWFRVLDDGEGKGETDRTTFVGFRGGAGISTSAEYCAVKPWPADNARTWPVSGNVQVQP
ncbi:MAG: hypothetical protein K2X35_00155 [Bryobacteraceae bacterium]|nr:hypothetical protein [Bryobacteraceae bacterium]